MLYTAMTKQALQICYQAHHGQSDKAGVPYVFHPLHLAEQMDTEEEVCVALLHDVMEDTPCTKADLQRAGFSPAVLNALQMLTRTPGLPYMQYVSALRPNPMARRVKQADLMHNMDLKRLSSVTGAALRRCRKYRIALAVLTEDFWDPSRRAFCKRIPLDLKNGCALAVFYKKNNPDEPARVLCYQILFESAPAPACELTPGEMEQLASCLRQKLADADRRLSYPELLAEYLAANPGLTPNTSPPLPGNKS